MIVLDTNVVSELYRQRSELRVVRWVDQQERANLFLTATVAAELLSGVAQMPPGHRREALQGQVRGLIDRTFAGRVLPFDLAAAEIYVTQTSAARAAGRTIAMGDGQIAAVALQHGFAVATRDTTPFEAAGVLVIDPWSYDAS